MNGYDIINRKMVGNKIPKLGEKMKLSIFYKRVIMLLFVVFLTSFFIEKTGAARRRSVACNSTARIEIQFRTKSGTTTKYYQNKPNACKSNTRECVYVGSTSEAGLKGIFDKWKNIQPAAAAGLKNYRSVAGNWVDVLIDAKCQGGSFGSVGTGKLKVTNDVLEFYQ